MMRRTFFVALSALALALWLNNSSFAKDEDTHEGTVVSVADGKITMSGKDAKDLHSHAVPAEAKITLNGKEAKLTELRKGDKIKVTMGTGNKVTRIDARRS